MTERDELEQAIEVPSASNANDLAAIIGQIPTQRVDDNTRGHTVPCDWIFLTRKLQAGAHPIYWTPPIGWGLWV